jgi:hypothetical protein
MKRLPFLLPIFILLLIGFKEAALGESINLSQVIFGRKKFL